MTYPNVESPVMGGKLRAGWGASVSSAIDAHEAELQALRRPGKWESLRAGDDAPLTPFAVRLHKTDDDEDGQWEIWLPPGCCNVGGTCEPMNTKANEKSGHEDDDASWYRFDFDHSMEYATEDGDGNQTNRFVVSAHAKTSAKEYGVDEIDAPARRLLWIGVVDFNRANDAGGEESYPDSVRYKDTPGDTWSCVVAEIRATRKAEQEQSGEGAEETKWSVVQRRTTPVDVALPAGAGVSGFDLVWNLAVGSDGKLDLSVFDFGLALRHVAVGGDLKHVGSTEGRVRRVLADQRRQLAGQRGSQRGFPRQRRGVHRAVPAAVKRPVQRHQEGAAGFADALAHELGSVQLLGPGQVNAQAA